MELSLEMAVKAFATWRATRTRKLEKIPDELKEMVKKLYPIHGTTVLRKALGITPNQFKKMGIVTPVKPSLVNPEHKELSNNFAVARVGGTSLNQSAELVLQKGQNSLTVKVSPNQLQNCLSMMATLL